MKIFSRMIIFCLLFSLAIKTSGCRRALTIPADQSKEQFLESVTSFYKIHPDTERTVDIVDTKFENCKVLDLQQLPQDRVRSLIDYALYSRGMIFSAPTRRYTLDCDCRLSSAYVLKYYIAGALDKHLPIGAEFNPVCSGFAEMMRTYRYLCSSVNVDESLRVASTIRISALERVSMAIDEALLQNVPTIKEDLLAGQQAIKQKEIDDKMRPIIALRNLRESLQGRKITDTICYQDEVSNQDQEPFEDGAAPAAQS
ncbi:MAG TPA: hypothetical protein VLG50_01010 [Candidatus Saccharimonadales bacterium]|nr:hypothetical protein [Candidatus Saccharimonadales bacterium]